MLSVSPYLNSHHKHTTRKSMLVVNGAQAAFSALIFIPKDTDWPEMPKGWHVTLTYVKEVVSAFLKQKLHS